MTMIGTNEVMVSPAPSGGPELIAFLNALEYLNRTKPNFVNFSVTSNYLESITDILQNLEDIQLREYPHIMSSLLWRTGGLHCF